MTTELQPGPAAAKESGPVVFARIVVVLIFLPMLVIYLVKVMFG